MDRRTFVVVSGAGLSARAFGANDRLRIGVLGCGGRGEYLARFLQKDPGVEFVAACDVYEPRRINAAQKFGPQAKAFLDYHEVLEHKDIDAVIIASTDHWHVPMTLDALAAGKDVYVEKPVTHTIEEGDKLTAAAEQSKQIVATGTQQRSWDIFEKAKGMVTSGEIGTLLSVDTYWQATPWVLDKDAYDIDQSKLDWDRYLGSAPKQEFDPLKVSRWRWFWDFGGGGFDDFMTHWIDVVQWVLDEKEPSMIAATGVKLGDWRFPVFNTMNALIAYPGGQTATYSGSYIASKGEGGLIFRGTKAILELTRLGYTLNGKQIVKIKTDTGTPANLANWVECVRSRKEPKANIRAGVFAARTSHLCNQSALRKAPDTAA